jgi:hypothetical protein
LTARSKGSAVRLAGGEEWRLRWGGAVLGCSGREIKEVRRRWRWGNRAWARAWVDAGKSMGSWWGAAASMALDWEEAHGLGSSKESTTRIGAVVSWEFGDCRGLWTCDELIVISVFRLQVMAEYGLGGDYEWLWWIAGLVFGWFAGMPWLIELLSTGSWSWGIELQLIEPVNLWFLTEEWGDGDLSSLSCCEWRIAGGLNEFELR